MEKPWRLWGSLERWALALASWSWAACRVSLLALILSFHLYGGFFLLALILASVAGILYKFQDVLLYFPDQPSSSRLYVPMPSGIPHESVYIRTKDGVKLNLILLRYTGGDSLSGPAAGGPDGPSSSTSPPTILYFHGNAGNIGHRVPNALLMLVNLKANVVLVDYRGYGKSEGEPGEKGLGMIPPPGEMVGATDGGAGVRAAMGAPMLALSLARPPLERAMEMEDSRLITLSDSRRQLRVDVRKGLLPANSSSMEDRGPEMDTCSPLMVSAIWGGRGEECG
jgi:hypothetical protein